MIPTVRTTVSLNKKHRRGFGATLKDAFQEGYVL